MSGELDYSKGAAAVLSVGKTPWPAIPGALDAGANQLSLGHQRISGQLATDTGLRCLPAGELLAQSLAPGEDP